MSFFCFDHFQITQELKVKMLEKEVREVPLNIHALALELS